MSRNLPRVVRWDNFPTPYGVEWYNALADRGNLDLSVWFSRRIDPHGSWVVDESTWRFHGTYVEDPSRSLTDAHRFVRRCDEVRPDLIIAEYGERAFAAGHTIFKALRLRTALTVEPTFDAWVQRAWWKETAKGALFRSADAGMSPGADGVGYGRRYGFPEHRIFQVRHTTNVPHFGRACSDDARRAHRLCLGVNGCVFLFVGRLWTGKGLLTLIDAFRRVQTVNREVSLLIVGSGPDEQRIRRAAEGLDAVVFHPFVERENLPAYYAAADVFVFPTLGDPHGQVVEEAHAAGLPVISSDAAGDVRRRVDDGVSGFVVPAGDVEALAGRMLELAVTPTRRAAMGVRGAVRVQSWGHDTYAEEFERFVHDALTAEPRRTTSACLAAAAGRVLVAMADVAARGGVWRTRAEASGLFGAVSGTLASRANRLGLWLVSLPWRIRRPRLELGKFGTDYQGWVLPPRALTTGGVCYSVGVGEDTSFEDDLLRKTDCRVWSFDPTPRAVAHVAKQALDAERFRFVPVAVWDAPGSLRLFAHPDPTIETCSPVNLWRTESSVEVTCTTVRMLMQDLGHDRLLLLKITIGGGEWRVLENLFADAPPVSVLCVEFNQPAAFWRVAAMVARLGRAGFRYCCHDRWKFTFAAAEGPSRAWQPQRWPGQNRLANTRVSAPSHATAAPDSLQAPPAPLRPQSSACAECDIPLRHRSRRTG
jgi:FkbM family methyltransferase